MGIQKKDSYRKLACAALLILMVCHNAVAHDRHLADYSNGIDYFKAGDLEEALSSFEKYESDIGSPYIVRLCSINMVGQIYRMQAKDDKALIAFEKLIEQAHELFREEPNKVIPLYVSKLVTAAGFAKAEIYQYNHEYDRAIGEYKRIVDYLKAHGYFEANSYAPLALDRMSQLYLISGRVEDYYDAAGELIKKHPSYYRTGIVKFEAEAIKKLRQQDDGAAFARGSYDAPARLIELIKESGDNELNESTSLVLEGLLGQHKNSYSGVLLGYHYAWVLDAAGEREKAIELFEIVGKEASQAGFERQSVTLITNALGNYAKLQQAVILGDKNKYREAIGVIKTLDPDANDVHIFNLSNSIGNAMETLKREVPKDANDQ